MNYIAPITKHQRRINTGPVTGLLYYQNKPVHVYSASVVCHLYTDKMATGDSDPDLNQPMGSLLLELSDDEIRSLLAEFGVETAVQEMTVDTPVTTQSQSTDPAPPAPATEPLIKTEIEHNVNEVEAATVNEPVDVIENNPRRFGTVSEEQIKKYEMANQSTATKKNTAWGIKIFQDWSAEIYGENTNLATITSDNLSAKLMKFYCEARPKVTSARKQMLPAQQAEVYHKNTLLNIRGAVNRHLQDIGRDMDIVRDKEFKIANKTLDGLLKEKTRSGLSRPTAHKNIIQQSDLQAISTYLSEAERNPIILRQAVWFNIALHFVSRGSEFHYQLRQDSFDFSHDENGEYVKLNHTTQQKNYQGGVNKLEAPGADKRMYSVPTSPCCPVKLLKLLMTKTDPGAHSLFNQYNKDAFLNPQATWFTSVPLAQRTFNNFLPDICKAAAIETRYTNHCLRATAIQYLNDAGYDARHIMYMSGHRNESSIRSYNRSVSLKQKVALSSTLSAIAHGENRENQVTTPGRATVPSVVDPRVSVGQVTLPCAEQNTSYTSGYLSNSMFSGCSFTINHHHAS